MADRVLSCPFIHDRVGAMTISRETQRFMIWHVARPVDGVISMTVDDIAYQTRLSVNQVRTEIRFAGWRLGQPQERDINTRDLVDLLR